MEKHDEKHVHHCGCGHCHQAQESVHRTEEHAHHEEEEENLFPKVRGLLDEDELERLGEAMLALQQQLRQDGDPRAIAPAEQDAATPLP